MKYVESQVYILSMGMRFFFSSFFPSLFQNRQVRPHTRSETHAHAHRLACPREIKSQLRGRKTNLEGQTKHLSSCVCLVGSAALGQ